MRMDLSMRLDLPTPASPSTSTFKVTRLSKIFSRVIFVIGWRRHSHLVQAKHQNLDQVLVTEETTDSMIVSTCTGGRASYWRSRLHKRCGHWNRWPEASYIFLYRVLLMMMVLLFFIVLYKNRWSEASYVFVLIAYCWWWWRWWWWW